MQHPEWNQEQERLAKVIAYITESLRKKFDEKNHLVDEQSEINRSMWEDAGSIADLESMSEFMQHIDMLKQNMAWSKKTAQEIVRLDKQRLNPYFGRIDFQETNEAPGKIYIGIHTVIHDQTGEILIYDWRAPISSMFYDFETGPASFLSPRGVIRGEITLKRQYRISGGRLVLMFDSSVAIHDNILQEILAANASGRMKTIVSTIQKEQNAAIRHDKTRVLAVQGAAGSGKTSVAMHRASYLLYRHKKTIKSENLVILSSTDVLGDYISEVLPELGEEAVKGTPYPHIFDKYAHIGCKAESQPQMVERVLTRPEDEEIRKRMLLMSFKTSKEYPAVLDRLFGYALKHMVRFEPLVYKNHVIATQKELEDLFYGDFAAMPAAQRFKRIEKRIEERMKPIKKEEAEKKAEELENEGVYVSRSEAGTLSKLSVREEARSFQDKMGQMLNLSPGKIYSALFSSRDAMKACLPENMDESVKKVWLDEAVRPFKNGRIAFEDLGPLLYLSLLLGYAEADDSVKHLIVDEAQDYSPIQLLSLAKLFPSAGITLLGDVSQNINPYAALPSLRDGAELISKDYAYLTLDKSYRSTVEIKRFCDRFTSADPGEAFGRHGGKPALYLSETAEALLKNLAALVKREVDQGRKTVAIITKTLLHAQKLLGDLKPRLSGLSCPFRLVDESYEYALEGVMVIPAYLSKGLEFDSVHIVLQEAGDYAAPSEKGLFYTVLSRALHQLSMHFGKKHVPGVLEGIDSALYESMPVLI